MRVWRARFVVARGTLAVACVFVVGNANTQRTRFCIHYNTQRAVLLVHDWSITSRTGNATAPQSTILHDWSITSVLGRTGDNPQHDIQEQQPYIRKATWRMQLRTRQFRPPSPQHLQLYVAPSHAHMGGGRQLSSRAGRGRLYTGVRTPTQRAGARCGAHWGGAGTKG